MYSLVYLKACTAFLSCRFASYLTVASPAAVGLMVLGGGGLGFL